jgi:phage baseplate assembly protein W
MAILKEVTSTGITVKFSDVNPFVSEENPNELNYDEEAIKASIMLILSTSRKSRIFRRNFGSNLDDLLFDPMDDVTVQRLKTYITSSITEWETRIRLTSSVVRPDYAEQQYFVQLEYTIPALQNKNSTLVFNLSKG